MVAMYFIKIHCLTYYPIRLIYITIRRRITAALSVIRTHFLTNFIIDELVNTYCGHCRWTNAEKSFHHQYKVTHKASHIIHAHVVINHPYYISARHNTVMLCSHSPVLLFRKILTIATPITSSLSVKRDVSWIFSQYIILATLWTARKRMCSSLTVRHLFNLRSGTS